MGTTATGTLVLGAFLSALLSGLPARATTAAYVPEPADPAPLVHPLDGTSTGPVAPGTVGEFPGPTSRSA